MSRIVVLHPKPEEIAAGLTTLGRAGHEVEPLWPTGMPEVGPLRRDPPDVFVIDLARSPSQGQALATAFRQLKSLRGVPLVFLEGDPAKTARVKAALPDATYGTWRGVRGAVRRALARPPASAGRPGNDGRVLGDPVAEEARDQGGVLRGPSRTRTGEFNGQDRGRFLWTGAVRLPA